MACTSFLHLKGVEKSSQLFGDLKVLEPKTMWETSRCKHYIDVKAVVRGLTPYIQRMGSSLSSNAGAHQKGVHDCLGTKIKLRTLFVTDPKVTDLLILDMSLDSIQQIQRPIWVLKEGKCTRNLYHNRIVSVSLPKYRSRGPLFAPYCR